MNRSSVYHPEWNESVGTMISHLEDSDFLSILLEIVGEFIHADNAMIFQEKALNAPKLICDRGIWSQKHRSLLNQYISGECLSDPVFHAIYRGVKPGFYHITEICNRNFNQSSYYTKYYKETNLLEDAYYLVQVEDDTMLQIFLGRRVGSPLFNEEELSYLRAVEPIIRNVVTQHWKNFKKKNLNEEDPAQGLQQQLQKVVRNFGSSILTKRETEVIQMMLHGHSVKSSAYEMGISPDTVKMHRKNIYSKLRVSAQSEIFSLFINSVFTVPINLDQDPLDIYFASQQGY